MEVCTATEHGSVYLFSAKVPIAQTQKIAIKMTITLYTIFWVERRVKGGEDLSSIKHYAVVSRVNKGS